MTGECLVVFDGRSIQIRPDRGRLFGAAEGTTEGTTESETTLEAATEPTEVDARRPATYRLEGIQVEPLDTDMGEQAQNVLAALLVGQDVEIKLGDRRESEGIVYAQATGACMQLELLAKGLARVAGSHPVEWEAVQKEAKAKKLGVWQ